MSRAVVLDAWRSTDNGQPGSEVRTQHEETKQRGGLIAVNDQAVQGVSNLHSSILPQRPERVRALILSGMTARSIAETLGISHQRVRQIANRHGLQMARGWPMRVAPPKPAKPSDADRFWKRVLRSDDPEVCWEWSGSRTPQLYGKFYSRGERYGYAHRFSYRLAFGPIPPGMHVCHRCDNPPCVNPNHLFLGTAVDNAADRDAKGRNGKVGKFGEASRTNVLTEGQVREIISLKGSLSYRKIATRYGVCYSAIKAIMDRRTWSHLICK